MKAEGEYTVRFRHIVADIGPLVFTKDSTIVQVKECLLKEWPRDGLIPGDIPASIKEIMLIIGGQVVDEDKSLFDYQRDLGDLGPDCIQTIHLVIRKPLPSRRLKKESKTTCCCLVQ